jgi:hypothetical protein
MLSGMALPERVFVIVVESETGREVEQMPLLSRSSAGGMPLAPAFSSMLLATTFLARAQELGHFVRLVYIFPADSGRLSADFPGLEFRLDPSPEAFFEAPRTV